MIIKNAAAMSSTCVVPRIAPTGTSFQGRGVSAGSLGGIRLRDVRTHGVLDAIALERDSRPGAVTV